MFGALAFAPLLRRLEAEQERWFFWVPVLLGVGIGAYFSLPFEPHLATALGPFAVALTLRAIAPARLAAGAGAQRSPRGDRGICRGEAARRVGARARARQGAALRRGERARRARGAAARARPAPHAVGGLDRRFAGGRAAGARAHHHGQGSAGPRGRERRSPAGDADAAVGSGAAGRLRLRPAGLVRADRRRGVCVVGAGAGRGHGRSVLGCAASAP